VLAVSATGIGMILEQQRIIFCPFVHGDSGVAIFSAGASFASLVQEIVSFMGGEITLHGSASQGLLFTCEISFQNVMLRYSTPRADKLQHLVYRRIRGEQGAGLLGDEGSLRKTSVREGTDPVNKDRICRQREDCTSSSRVDGTHRFIHSSARVMSIMIMVLD
jgi:hypothetical protein